MTLRSFFLAGAMAAAFLFAGVGTAQARGNCRERIQREEFKLQREIRRHGFYSRQAQNRREKIYRLRQQCGSAFFGRRDGRGRWGRDRDRNGRRDWRRDRDDWYWDGRRWRRR